ncbi:MAG TPA: hypothetical protein VI455_02575 [Terriglobia bacterium]
MGAAPTGSILIGLVDGTRQPLPATVQWSARIFDGRSPSEWQESDVTGTGSAELVKGLTFFDNLFDNYTVIVSASGYQGAAWKPVHIDPAKPAAIDLILIPDDAHLNFSGASWQTLNSVRPRFADIISTGINDAHDRYANLMEESGGLVLACLLNLLTAMSQITLPSGKSPLDYYWQPIWDDPQFAMAQDRFFAYADEALIDDVVKAGVMGSFAEEKDPGTLHPGATLSYKQTQFDVTNVQLTFHQGNAKTLERPDGSPVDCVVVEPDIDYFKDLLAHFFLEVVPNKVSGGLTDPRMVYVLRWMAGKQAGSDFNPLYTMTL